MPPSWCETPVDIPTPIAVRATGAHPEVAIATGRASIQSVFIGSRLSCIPNEDHVSCQARRVPGIDVQVPEGPWNWRGLPGFGRARARSRFVAMQRRPTAQSGHYSAL